LAARLVALVVDDFGLGLGFGLVVVRSGEGVAGVGVGVGSTVAEGAGSASGAWPRPGASAGTFAGGSAGSAPDRAAVVSPPANRGESRAAPTPKASSNAATSAVRTIGPGSRRPPRAGSETPPGPIAVVGSRIAAGREPAPGTPAKPLLDRGKGAPVPVAGRSPSACPGAS
jgi:hypothetical protein